MNELEKRIYDYLEETDCLTTVDDICSRLSENENDIVKELEQMEEGRILYSEKSLVGSMYYINEFYKIEKRREEEKKELQNRILSYLKQQKEPKSAFDMHDAFSTTHPISTQRLFVEIKQLITEGLVIYTGTEYGESYYTIKK